MWSWKLTSLFYGKGHKSVPNAPCGVERLRTLEISSTLPAVPNAPCGVESPVHLVSVEGYHPFLMHRVELKVLFLSSSSLLAFSVPNAPCGVESWTLRSSSTLGRWVPNAPCGVESFSIILISLSSTSLFLMHRVELKELRRSYKACSVSLFLMHRVELKVQGRVRFEAVVLKGS